MVPTSPLSHCSLAAGEIPPSPQCALVLEDEVGMCGYALALIDAKPAAAKIQVISTHDSFCTVPDSADKCSVISLFDDLLPPESHE